MHLALLKLVLCICFENYMVAERVLQYSVLIAHLRGLCVFNVFAAMASVMEASARFDELMRNREFTNAAFFPDRERQAVINTEHATKIAKLEEDAAKTETRTAR